MIQKNLATIVLALNLVSGINDAHAVYVQPRPGIQCKSLSQEELQKREEENAKLSKYAPIAYGVTGVVTLGVIAGLLFGKKYYKTKS